MAHNVFTFRPESQTWDTDPCACDAHDDHDAGQETYLSDEPSYWSPVEQGYYDDDPNPYHGDYSEM